MSASAPLAVPGAPDVSSASSNGNTSSLGASGNSAASRRIIKAVFSTSVLRTQLFTGSAWLKLWSWELSSMVFSILCMAAVVGILAAMDKRSLEEWKMPISPNALVSVFITLSKSALLLMVAEGISQLKWVYFQEQRRRLYDLQVFDDASRGPWGACILILSIRRKAIIALIGAVITVASLAMDPFAQQIIAYRTTPHNKTDGIALLRNARRYCNGYSSFGLDNFDEAHLPDYSGQMTTAILTGLSESIPQTSFSCETGNCTWPLVETIAVCNGCINLTGVIKPACGQMSPRIQVGMTDWFGAVPPSPIYQRTQNCSISSTEYPELSVNVSRLLRDFDQGYIYGDEESRINITAQMSCTDCLRSGNLARIFAVFPDASSPEVVIDPNTWATGVYQCSLNFCRKQYRTSVINGNLTETLINTQPLAFPSCLKYLPFYSPSADSVCPGFLADEVPPNLDNATLDLMAEDQNAYAVSQASVNLAKDQLLNTVVRAASSTYNSIGDTQAGDVLAVLLFYANGGNFTKTMDNIAAAMSHQVRHSSNATWISGWAQEPTTRVRVQWIWLTLPLALVLLSSAFLCLAMTISGQPARHVWKSAILGMAFHRIEGSNPDELDQRTLPEMENMAKKIDVILANDASGKVSLFRQRHGFGLSP